MGNLKSVLQDYRKHTQGKWTTLGEDKDARQPLEFQLARISKRSGIAFWICTAMAIVLFLGSVIIITIYISKDQVDKLNVIFASSGISLSGIIWYMHKVWKEKFATDMILVLVKDLSNDDLGRLLDKLMAKL